MTADWPGHQPDCDCPTCRKIGRHQHHTTLVHHHRPPTAAY